MNPPSSTLSGDHEGRLLRRFLAGEPAVVRTALRWARETAYFHGFGLGREEREDAVQDALAQLWTLVSRPGFELRHGLRALIRTLVAARCIDRMRRRRRAVALDATLADPAPGPFERAMARDERSRLRLALIELDTACREIIRMRFYEGLDYATIASREGRSESTLRVRLFGCIRELRRRWARSGA